MHRKWEGLVVVEVHNSLVAHCLLTLKDAAACSTCHRGHYGLMKVLRMTMLHTDMMVHADILLHPIWYRNA